MNPYHTSFRGPLIPGLALLVMVPGCGRFDRGPGGVWDELARPTMGPPVLYEDPATEGLPEPARRLLRWSIEEGTPRARSVEIRMEGTITLDPARGPIPMEAIQILAPPEGFIWSARTSGGLMRIRGFDRFSNGEGEMRWKLFGVIPVVRARGADVTRSAAARLAMEGLLVPAWLVPRGDAPSGVRWEGVDDTHARYRVVIGGEEVVTTVAIDEEGRPLRAWAERWNEGRYERFGVEFSGEIRSGGYRIPARVQAGWRLGEPDEFRFFDAVITELRYR